MKPIRIAILDDHAVVRQGLVSRLTEVSGITVVGTYRNSRELIRSLGASAATLLLLDFVLGQDDLDGISLIRALRTRFPDCPILVFSSRDDATTVTLSLQVGAAGFISKGESMTRLIKAIRTVASGSIYLSTTPACADLAQPYRKEPSRTNQDESKRALILSPKEQEVIRCYIDGLTITEIANKFKRSIKTISTQKNSAFRKLGISSNKELFKIMKSLD